MEDLGCIVLLVLFAVFLSVGFLSSTFVPFFGVSRSPAKLIQQRQA